MNDLIEKITPISSFGGSKHTIVWFKKGSICSCKVQSGAIPNLRVPV